MGIYLPLYDYLLTKMQRLGPYAPLAAGAAARTAAVLCTSPLELIRTRMQASFSASASTVRPSVESAVAHSSQASSLTLCYCSCCVPSIACGVPVFAAFGMPLPIPYQPADTHMQQPAAAVSEV